MNGMKACVLIRDYPESLSVFTLRADRKRLFIALH